MLENIIALANAGYSKSEIETIMSTNNTLRVQTQNVTPPVQTQDVTSVQTQNVTPTVQTQDVTPPVQTQNVTPPVQTQTETVVVKAPEYNPNSVIQQSPTPPEIKPDNMVQSNDTSNYLMQIIKSLQEQNLKLATGGTDSSSKTSEDILLGILNPPKGGINNE